ncbi:mucin-22-like [Athalia rosae]|uniref:mucin-22-like n=1 Tax=Athalia rosae TaxID=37344 RepID=UPI0020342335|nr:mucin-22-like [Athalia rosae]
MMTNVNGYHIAVALFMVCCWVNPNDAIPYRIRSKAKNQVEQRVHTAETNALNVIQRAMGQLALASDKNPALSGTGKKWKSSKRPRSSRSRLKGMNVNINTNRNIRVHSNTNNIERSQFSEKKPLPSIHTSEPIRENMGEDFWGREVNCTETHGENRTYSSSFTANGTLRALGLKDDMKVAGEVATKQTSSIHFGEDITLCWIETTTIKEDRNVQPPQRFVIREYTISFENSATIPERYLECVKVEGEIDGKSDGDVPRSKIFEVMDENTRHSRLVNFTTVRHTKHFTVWQHRRVRCGVGPVVTKNVVEWAHKGSENPKKRVEIKVSPKIHRLRVGSEEVEPCPKDVDETQHTKNITVEKCAPGETCGHLTSTSRDLVVENEESTQFYTPVSSEEDVETISTTEKIMKSANDDDESDNILSAGSMKASSIRPDQEFDRQQETTALVLSSTENRLLLTSGDETTPKNREVPEMTSELARTESDEFKLGVTVAHEPAAMEAANQEVEKLPHFSEYSESCESESCSSSEFHSESDEKAPASSEQWSNEDFKTTLRNEGTTTNDYVSTATSTPDIRYTEASEPTTNDEYENPSDEETTTVNNAISSETTTVSEITTPETTESVATETTTTDSSAMVTTEIATTTDVDELTDITTPLSEDISTSTVGPESTTLLVEDLSTTVSGTESTTAVTEPTESESGTSTTTDGTETELPDISTPVSEITESTTESTGTTTEGVQTEFTEATTVSTSADIMTTVSTTPTDDTTPGSTTETTTTETSVTEFTTDQMTDTTTPTTEDSVTEEITTEEPVTEETITEEIVTDESTTGFYEIEETTTEGSTTEATESTSEIPEIDTTAFAVTTEPNEETTFATTTEGDFDISTVSENPATPSDNNSNQITTETVPTEEIPTTVGTIVISNEDSDSSVVCDSNSYECSGSNSESDSSSCDEDSEDCQLSMTSSESSCDPQTEMCTIGPLISSTTPCDEQLGGCSGGTSTSSVSSCDPATEMCTTGPLIPSTTPCDEQLGGCSDVTSSSSASSCDPQTEICTIGPLLESTTPCDGESGEPCAAANGNEQFATPGDSDETCENNSTGSCTTVPGSQTTTQLPTTTSATTIEVENISTTVSDVPTTVESRRSTTITALSNNPQAKHKLALKIKILLEHIDENKNKQKLVEVEKHLLFDEHTDELGKESLMRQVKSLNNSVNIRTVQALFNCSTIEKLTGDMGEIANRYLAMHNGTENTDDAAFKQPHRRAERDLGPPESSQLDADVELSLPGIHTDIHSGLGHVMTRVSPDHELTKRSVEDIEETLPISRVLQLVSDPQDRRVRGRKKRQTFDELTIDERDLPQDIQEIGNWSNERVRRAVNGGHVRSLTEFTIYKG